MGKKEKKKKKEKENDKNDKILEAILKGNVPT